MFGEIYLIVEKQGVSEDTQEHLNSFCANYINNAPKDANFNSAISVMRVCGNTPDQITRSLDIVSQSYTVAVIKNIESSQFIQINSYHMQILEGLSTLVHNFSTQYEGGLPERMIQAIFYAI